MLPKREEALSLMTPEITEFSYGFALTNEVVGWADVSSAPIFPSLIEEGKAGGGYDVALDMAGVPLYLQFKRADCMVRSTACEIRDYALPIARPFYRFRITEAGKSDQHELLLALEQVGNLVCYAAPRFHRLSEINDAWNANRVAARSIFVSPMEIGTLDDESHHVSYDENNAWLCSEPKRIRVLRSDSLLEQIRDKLNTDSRPLREKLSELIEKTGAARELARERIAKRRRVLEEVLVEPISAGVTSEVPLRPPRDLSEAESALRTLSDDAAKIFNSQLIIVQPAEV